MNERRAQQRPQQRAVQLPLLDRLLDEAPTSAVDPASTPAEALQRLRASVQRDLEMLLNSRRRWRAWSPKLEELGRSAFGFGIADYASATFNDKRERQLLCAEMEATVRGFEKRLAGVRIMLQDSTAALPGALRLHITAVLRTDPAPEEIAFEATLDARTADIVVNPADV